MSEMYWEQFMTTGSVADYLNYKMGQGHTAAEKNKADVSRQNSREIICGRKEQRESDRTDGHGAFHDAGRGI